MKVELREEFSTSKPVQAAVIAARGDYMEDSLVGTSFEEAMERTDKNKREMVRHLLRRGHFGTHEHPKAFFAVEGISRVTMAQITRHRHMSHDVQSMRYVGFEQADVVVPESLRNCNETAELAGTYLGHVHNASDLYQRFVYELTEHHIENGLPERKAEQRAQEDARFILPLGTKVNMTFSGNIRALLHVFDLRHSGKAQWEIRELADQAIEELRDWCPIIVEEWEEHCKNASLQSP